MPGRIRRLEEGIQHGQTRIKGGFLCNGSTDPATLFGEGFTVVHTSTGVWTVTLTEPVSSFVHFALTLEMPTGELLAHQLQIGDKSVANKTFDIEHLASANTSTTHPVAADIAAATDQAIFFEVVVSRTGQPGST